MNTLSAKEKTGFKVITAILAGALVLFLLLDLIYGIALLTTKEYFSSFAFLSITPPQSARASILSQGIYTGVNWSSFLALIKQMLICIDYELVLIIFLYSASYYVGLKIKEESVHLDYIREGFRYFLTAYLLALLGTFVVVVNNLIPFHSSAYFCFWLGLVTLIQVGVKLGILAFISYHFYRFIKKEN